MTRFRSMVRYAWHRPTAILLCLIWLGYAAVASFVMGIDPYDVYSWGKQVFVPGNYAPFQIVKAIRLAARDKTSDLVLIGASPTTVISQADLHKAYPDYANPWTVSYHGAASADRAQTVQQFVKYSSAKRYIITLDYFYALPTMRTREAFPDYQYDDDPFNDLRAVNTVTLRAAISVFRHGSPFPDERGTREQELGFQREQRSAFHNARRMRQLKTWVDRYRSSIARPSQVRCDRLPGLKTLLRQAAALNEKGARVDILIPPYALAIYYEFTGDPILHEGGGNSMLMDQLAMRKCAVLGAEGLSATHVYSMDLDFALSADLNNFRDSAHMEGERMISTFLGLPNDQRYELTRANIDSYTTALRRAVESYRLATLPVGSGK